MDDYIFTAVNQDSTPKERATFEHQLLKEMAQEYTPLDCVDYFVDANGKVPMSFAQIKTVEEGYEWYQRHHPELLDDLVWAMARHQFGGAEGKPPPKVTDTSVAAVTFTQKHVQLDF
jgi:hypothetical protein